MASKYDTVRERLRRGQEAKERVTSRVASGSSSDGGTVSKYDTVRNRPAGLQPTNTRPDVLERQQQLQERRLNPTGTPGTYTPPAPTQQPTRLPTFQEQIANATRFPDVTQEQRFAGARELPVVGPALQYLDKFTSSPVGEFIGEYGPSFVTPGTGPANVLAARGAVLAGLGRLAPTVAHGTGLGSRIATEAAAEFVLGAPIGAGQTLVANPGASGREVVEGAAAGALGGAALGALGTVAGQGIRSLVQGRTGAGTAAPDVPVPGGQAPDDATPPPFTPEPPQPNRSINTPEEIATPQGGARTLDTSPIDLPTPGQVELPAGAARGPRRDIPENERAFFSNLESGDLTDDVRAGLQDIDRMYEPITNKGTLDQVNRRLSREGIDVAESKLLGRKKFTADDVVMGQRLIQELQSSGQHERAVTVAQKVAEKLTEAGQTIQASSIWNRLDPDGALIAAQRRVASVNEGILDPAKKVKISKEQGQAIMDTAATIQRAGASQERAAEVLAIMNKAERGAEITAEERKYVLDFVQDAKRYVKKEDVRKPPADVQRPAEMRKPGVTTRVQNFLETQEEAARNRIRARRGRLSSTPLDEWADYAIIGASKMAKGALKFSDWSQSMVRDYGRAIQPQLRKLYAKSRDTFRAEAKRVSQEKITEAEKIAENYVKRNEARLSQADIDAVRKLAGRISNLSGKEQRMASQEMQALLNTLEKPDVFKKIGTLQLISLLYNPLTQIRNIVGNELLYRIERLQRVFGTPLDFAQSKLTGSKRTITFKRGPSVWENYFQPSKDFAEGLREGLSAGYRGVNPEGLQSKYDVGSGQAFRIDAPFQGNVFNRASTALERTAALFEKTLGAALQGFDYASYNRAVNQRLSELAYLDAINAGVKGNDAIRAHMQTVLANTDNTIYKIASDYGKYVTLQDNTYLSRGLQSMRRWLNLQKDYGAGSVLVPFAKTPANLLMRSLDYSPAGIVKAFWQAGKVLRDPKSDLTSADVMESVTRSLFGTSAGALAWWLADLGALWGSTSDDPEIRKLKQASGQTDFQLNGSAFRRMIGAAMSGGDVRAAAKIQPGDTLWAYNWAAPAATPIVIGASAYTGASEKQGLGQTAANAAFNAINTVIDSSVLASVREIFDVPAGEDNWVRSMALNLIEQAPSQFVPSLLRQINTLSDDTVRETYAQKGDFLGSVFNYAQSSVPGLAQQLPQRVSTLGEPQTRLNNFIDVFVSPAQRNVYKPTAEGQLVIDLLNETGDSTLAPRAVAKYITGKNATTGESEKIDLTPEEYVRLQELVGRETAERLKQVNPGWSTEQKVKFVKDALTEAGKVGRDTLKREHGLVVSR